MAKLQCGIEVHDAKDYQKKDYQKKDEVKKDGKTVQKPTTSKGK